MAKFLRKISYVADGIYSIEVADENGPPIQTICHISDECVRQMTFDSCEFNEEIMKGNLYIRPICYAVSVFHETVTKPFRLSTEPLP